jgi:hypothetical protein
LAEAVKQAEAAKQAEATQLFAATSGLAAVFGGLNLAANVQAKCVERSVQWFGEIGVPSARSHTLVGANVRCEQAQR